MPGTVVPLAAGGVVQDELDPAGACGDGLVEEWPDGVGADGDGVLEVCGTDDDWLLLVVLPLGVLDVVLVEV